MNVRGGGRECEVGDKYIVEDIVVVFERSKSIA